MSDKPPEIDLKFLPDWLKEGPADNRYANYEGEREDRPRRDGSGGGGFRGPRPGPGGDRRGPSNDRRPARPGQRPDSRAPQAPRAPGGDPKRDAPRGDRPNRPGGPGGPRRDGPPRPGGRTDRPPERRFEREERPAPEVLPAEVRIEFVPEPHGAASIAKQVRQSSRAYPLFGTGRLFLERPERHRVRFSSMDPAMPLHQIADGPIAFDKAILERTAWRSAKEQYYKEEVVQGEPLKGNFANVARCRSTGTLLGPTNYHAYQPGLRKLYEERFSRRMPFPEFVQKEIEVVNDEKVVAEWKEQARSSTTFTTTQEEPPVSFSSVGEAEAHFRKTYLPTLIKSGKTLECPGTESRVLPERALGAAVRDAWERERGFPAGLVNNLRPFLIDAGLQFFKHRKRVLFISAIRPVRHASGQVFSGNISAILDLVENTPRCTRRDLAVKILGEGHEAPEALEAKAALARDLHYLIHAGNVIEFSDGSLDLPFAPPAPQQPGPAKQGKAVKPEAAAAAVAATDTLEGNLPLDQDEESDPAEGTSAANPEDGPDQPPVLAGSIAPGDHHVDSTVDGFASGERESLEPIEQTLGESAMEVPLPKTAPVFIETADVPKDVPTFTTSDVPESASYPSTPSFGHTPDESVFSHTSPMNAEHASFATGSFAEAGPTTDLPGTDSLSTAPGTAEGSLQQGEDSVTSAGNPANFGEAVLATETPRATP